MSHYFSCRLRLFVLLLLALFVCAARAQAQDISGGTISSTVTITQDSELMGDVTCMVTNGPCIVLGASDITLRLNGFSITEGIAGCTPATSSQDGIDVLSRHDVAIRGPGLVQKFGGFGIFLFLSTKVRVEGVTASDNCFSGILLAGTKDSDIEKNVSVRNAMGSEGAPCGGT